MKLNPPSNLLMGPAGTGKTSALATYVECGVTVRMIATEPTAPARVLQHIHQRKLDPAMFDWQFISPAPGSWDALTESADIVSRLSLKDMADMRTGIAKPDSKQWIKLLHACKNFISDKDGKEHGDVTMWTPAYALAIDGLTGINTMSRNLTVGLKPNPSPGEWGIMQNNILTLIGKLAADCECHFTCIAHVERESNELTGVSNITVSTLGAKLAPKLPPLFTNVIYAQRKLDKFYWSTMTQGVDTKNGDLPLREDMPPSFRPIVESFLEKLKAMPAAAAPAGVALKQS